jgi:hypothetical protein
MCDEFLLTSRRVSSSITREARGNEFVRTDVGGEETRIKRKAGKGEGSAAATQRMEKRAGLPPSSLTINL